MTWDGSKIKSPLQKNIIKHLFHNIQNIGYDVKGKHFNFTIGQDEKHKEIGYNYRLSNVSAAIGCGQFENLDKFIEEQER